MTTKTFLVELKMNIGEFEKYSNHFVEAETKEKAVERALLGECHHDLDDGAEWMDEDKDQISDDFGGMIYTSCGAKEIDEKDVDILKKYL